MVELPGSARGFGHGRRKSECLQPVHSTAEEGSGFQDSRGLALIAAELPWV
jgi:hypothetical protein